MIAYRKEIDGLRALAVLPVILFHAGFSAFSGGFVGVDVFFVISGFLITSIIVSDLDRGTFSLVTFYERRARRIVPALFLVLVTCAVFAWLWLLPNDLRAFAKSFASVPVFASNVVFARESGYFDSAAELKVLLHTWSLAVEEQYYLLFPVFMIGCWRIGKRWVMPALLVVLVVSLALAQRASMTNPDAAFFWLPMRAWELMVGAVTAVWLAQTTRPLPRAVRELAGWSGLALILCAVVSYDHSTPFPGGYALPPTIGTALIIACTTQGTTLGALLGHRAVVAMGLVSYSAYLWHQPVLALARYRFGPGISDAILILLCVLVFGLAYLTWKFVEAPFRNRSLISRRAIFRMNLIGGTVLLLIGLWGYQTDGFLDRAKWDPIRDAQITAREKASGFRYCGDHRVTSDLTTYPVCLIGDSTQPPEGVLWGDSYAGSLLFGMHEQLVKAKRSYYAVLSDGCTPIAGGSKPSFGCTDARQRLFVANFLRSPDLRRLIWVGRFEAVIGQAVDSTFLLDSRPSSPAGFRARLLEMAAQFRVANKDVVFVSTTPSFPESVPGRVTRLFRAPDDTASSVQRLRKDLMRQRLGSDPQFLAAMQQQVRVLDGLDVLCTGEVCASHDASGTLLYVDDGHISHVASRRLAAAVLQTFDRTP